MQDWTHGYDQFIQEIIGGKMNDWGDSTVATKYMYQRIHEILDMEEMDDVAFSLSRLMDELANNFKADTGKLIEEKP